MDVVVVAALAVVALLQPAQAIWFVLHVSCTVKEGHAKG